MPKRKPHQSSCRFVFPTLFFMSPYFSLSSIVSILLFNGVFRLLFGPTNGAQLTPRGNALPFREWTRGIPNVHSGETIVISLDRPGGTQVPTPAPRALARLF